jgi:hypothetical protein
VDSLPRFLFAAWYKESRMPEVIYRNRRAVALENEHLQVVVSVEGGHLAAIEDKASGVNPLWAPPWPSIEPSTYDEARHPEYGRNSESRLLSGILGHNLCLDLFGGPTEEEARAGMTVHGEGSVVPYTLHFEGDTLICRASLPMAQLAFERRIRLQAGSRVVGIEERVENLSACDRPIAWTQHVTLGPPFLEKGRTLFRASASKSKVIENDFTGGHAHLKTAEEFYWPEAPTVNGGIEDLQVFTSREKSGAFTTHLMDPSSDEAFFLAWNPGLKLACGYAWRRADFPWLGVWEENHLRESGPWNGKALTRGMEFGVSPFPESRRAMIDRHGLFGVPGYRWAPAKTTLKVSYRAFVAPAGSCPEAPLA